MRLRPLGWLLLSALCFAGVFYFWRLGDRWAAQRAATLDMAFARVPTPGTDPRFVAMIVDLVREQVNGVPDNERQAMSPLGPWPQQCAHDCCLTPPRPDHR